MKVKKRIFPFLLRPPTLLPAHSSSPSAGDRGHRRPDRGSCIFPLPCTTPSALRLPSQATKDAGLALTQHQPSTNAWAFTPFDTHNTLLCPLHPPSLLPVGHVPTALLQNKTQHKSKNPLVSLQTHEVLISLSKNYLYLCYFLTSRSYFSPRQLGFQIHRSKEKALVTFPNQTDTFLFWAAFQSDETLQDFQPGFSLAGSCYPKARS